MSWGELDGSRTNQEDPSLVGSLSPRYEPLGSSLGAPDCP